MKDIIHQIIEAGTYAPSGDNSQPWEFKIQKNESIKIYNTPNRDIPLYNYGQFGSMIAHGALLENINIAAEWFGYKTEIQLFPDNEPQCVANVKFIKGNNVNNNPLFNEIKKRATNRKPYKKIPLSVEEKTALLSSINQNDGVLVSLLEDRDAVEKISQISTINERVVLETQDLHKIFFKHVVWNKKEELEKRTGLYIKTLELGPPQELVFRLYKHWPIAKFLNSIGFSKIIARDNAKLYSTSSALAIFEIQNKNQSSYIHTGMLMQRLWLNATKINLSAHPVTGVLFLINSIDTKEAKILNTKQKKEIQDAYHIINQYSQVKTNFITMILRIGKADEPSAHSSRLNANIQDV